MKVHRFYLPAISLSKEIHVDDKELLHQWNNVLRLHEGELLRLFDGKQKEGIYILKNISKKSAVLVENEQLTPLVSKRKRALCWSLLKKDNNEFVLQKGTELGITHFFPMIADKTEKTGFPLERAMKILQEAAEQCGRADIPTVCEPRTVQQLVLDQALHWQFVVLEKGGWSLSSVRFQSPLALLVGPEGGWSERELALFSDQQIPKISISQFTLRAETAAVAGATILGQLLDAPFD